MAKLRVEYITDKPMDCGCCGGDAYICVPKHITTDGAPFIEVGILGVQTRRFVGNTKYAYTLEYEGSSLIDSTMILTPFLMRGMICKGCLTDYIDWRSRLDVEDTSTLNLTLLDRVLSGDVVLSQAPGNTLSINPDGLYGSVVALNPIDTDTVDLTITGGTIQADVVVSNVPGNILTATPDGLFVPTPPPPPAETPNTATNTASATVTLTGTLDRDIQVDVEVSQAAGNTIVINADGIFSAGGGVDICETIQNAGEYNIATTPTVLLGNTDDECIARATLDERAVPFGYAGGQTTTEDASSSRYFEYLKGRGVLAIGGTTIPVAAPDNQVYNTFLLTLGTTITDSAGDLVVGGGHTLNYVRESLIGGVDHTLDDIENSVVVGDTNALEEVEGSFVAGQGNTIGPGGMRRSLLIGANNSFENTGDTTGLWNSIIAGSDNQALGSGPITIRGTIISGENNSFDGLYAVGGTYISSIYNSVIVGAENRFYFAEQLTNNIVGVYDTAVFGSGHEVLTDDATVYTDPSYNSGHFGSLIFGSGNYSRGTMTSLVGGSHNRLKWVDNSLIVGTAIQDQFPYIATSTEKVRDSFVAGSSHILNANSGLAVSGYAHQVSADSVLVAGWQNVITAAADYGGVVGRGLVAQREGQVVVGEYNVAQGTGASTDDQFIVGTGISGGRKTGFSVRRDGIINPDLAIPGFYMNNAAAITALNALGTTNLKNGAIASAIVLDGGGEGSPLFGYDQADGLWRPLYTPYRAPSDIVVGVVTLTKSSNILFTGTSSTIEWGSYRQGAVLSFTVSESNVGPISINVNGLGNRGVAYLNNPLKGGELRPNIRYLAVYTVTTWHLVEAGNIRRLDSGWDYLSPIGTRTGTHSFTIPSERVGELGWGDPIAFTDGGSTKYGNVASTSFASGVTTINLIPNSTYDIANGTITHICRGNVPQPYNFPGLFSWDNRITHGGFSTVPSYTAQFRVIGRQLTMYYYTWAAGVSNANTLTMTIPLAIGPIYSLSNIATGVDNGGRVMDCFVVATPSSNTIFFNLNNSSTGWTPSGQKYVYFNLTMGF